MPGDPDWKRYEKHIVKKIREWVGPDARIDYDVNLPASKSGGERQIDILVTTTLAGFDEEVTIAIDCKRYDKNINVGHADKFVGLIEDVQTDFGFLITNGGWSDAAEARLERSMRIRHVADEPVISIAPIDSLPPLTFTVEWGDDYCSGEFWDNHFSNEFGSIITFRYVERESPVPIDHPDQLEWLEDPVASGTSDELSWADVAGKRAAAETVLAHYLGGPPDSVDVDLFVDAFATKWEDGQTWSVEIDAIENVIGIPPSIVGR